MRHLQPWARYCSRCGTDGFVAVDERHFHCRACHFDYYHNLAAVVCALIRHQDRIALIVRGRDPGRGLLDLPGGFVDPGESLEAAVNREVREEIGIVITKPRYLFSAPNTYPYGGVTYSTVDAVFETTIDAVPALTPNDEVVALRWRTLGEIDLGEVAFESIRNTLGRLRESATALTGET